MAVNRPTSNADLEQGSSYEEEEFNAPTGSQRIRGPLRANSASDIANEDDSDEEDDEEDDYNDDDSILDKIKQNPVILLAIVAVVAVIIIIIVLVISSTGKKDDSSDEDTEITENENSLSEDELKAEMEALQHQVVDEPAPVEDKFQYSDEERQAMIAWGLSMAQIEENEANEVSPVDAIKGAREEMMTNKAEVYKALLRNATDNPNESYHYVLGNSVFGLPIQPEDFNEQRETYYSESQLVDFRKIPLQGYQAMLRVVVPNTDYVFYVTIPYVKYLELPEQGNCNMRWDVTEKNGVKMFTNFTLID